MGKTAACISMLQILNSGRIYKVSELADLLETNPRNVVEYKRELELMGYNVLSIPGRYGGYQLEKSSIVPSLKMSHEEKAALIDAFNYVLAKKDFVNKNGYIKVMSKIFSALLIENDSPAGILNVEKTNSSIGQSLIEQNYATINQAIKNKTVLKITYRWLKEPKGVITVHPYQLFLYDNEWRFFGWLVERGEVCYFKLSRAENIEITDKKFKVWKHFKAEDYIKNNVFAQNGEMFRLTLLAYGVRANLFKEKQFGSNQQCEERSDGSLKVVMDMQKNSSTYNAILGWGDLVTILEPQWLVEKIRDLSAVIHDKYCR